MLPQFFQDPKVKSYVSFVSYVLKTLKRKPLAALFLLFIIFMAIITVTRLHKINSNFEAEEQFLMKAQPDVESAIWVVNSPSPEDLNFQNNLAQKAQKASQDKLKLLHELKTLTTSNKTSLLMEVFPKVDKNHDKKLSLDELANWIGLKVKEHMQTALRENIFLFTAIDTDPRNASAFIGKISWKEYHAWFLRKHGLSEGYLAQHDEKHPELQRSIKEIIAWDQAAWSEVAKFDPESLNIDEFLSFKHPESSQTNLLSRVDDLLAEFDQDGDEALSWVEYSAIPASNPSLRLVATPSLVDAKRQEEFLTIMDFDKDGKLNKRELLKYLDPRNKRHAALEAEALVNLSDANGDGQISLAEMLQHADLFIASKMVETAKSFHDEF